MADDKIVVAGDNDLPPPAPKVVVASDNELPPAIKKKEPATQNSSPPAKPLTGPSDANGPVSQDYLKEANAGLKTPEEQNQENFEQGKTTLAPHAQMMNNLEQGIVKNHFAITDLQNKIVDASNTVNKNTQFTPITQLSDLYAKLQGLSSGAVGATDPKNKKQADEINAQIETLRAQPVRPTDNPISIQNLSQGAVNDQKLPDYKTYGEMYDATANHSQNLANGVPQLNTMITQQGNDIKEARDLRQYTGAPMSYAQTFGNSFSTSVDNMVMGFSKYALSDEERTDLYKRKYVLDNIVYPKTAPDNLLGSAVGALGSVAPYTASALTGEGLMPLLVSGIMMGSEGAGGGGYEGFVEGKNNGMSDTDALNYGKKMAIERGTAGTVLGATLPGMGALGEKMFLNGVEKNAFTKFIAQQGVMAPGFGASQVTQNLFANYLGNGKIDRDPSQGFTEAVGSSIALGGMLQALHSVPDLPAYTKQVFEMALGKRLPQVQGAVTQAVSNGTLDAATAQTIMTGVNEKAEAQAIMPPGLSPEEQLIAEPYITKVLKLATQKATDKAGIFHEDIDRQITDATREMHEKLGTPLSIDEQQTLGELQSRATTKGEDGKLVKPLTPTETDLKDHLEARVNSIEGKQQAKDNGIVEKQQANNLPTAPELNLTKGSTDKLAQIENGEIITNNTRTKTNEGLQLLVDELNSKIKALTATRDNANRRYSRNQIDVTIADLQNKVDKIESARKNDKVAEAISFVKHEPVEVGNVENVGHTEDTHSKDGVLNGQGDAGLTDKGKEDAANIGKKFAVEDPNIGTIYHGTIERVAETGKTAADAASEVTGKPVKTVANELLNTWDTGTLTGLAKHEFDETHFVNNPEEKVPGGESFNEFKDRAIKAWEWQKGLANDAKAITSSKVQRMFEALNATNGEWNEQAKDIFLGKEKANGTEPAKVDTTTPAGSEIPKGEQVGEVEGVDKETTGEADKEFTIGTKNAITDKLLDEMDLPELVKSDVKNNKATFGKVKVEVDNETRDPLQIAKDFLAGKKEFLNDEDHFAIDYALAKNKNERLDADQRVAKFVNSDTPEGKIEYAKALQDKARLREESNIYIKAAKEVGTVWGRAGQARQKEISEDYSIQHIEARLEAANAAGKVSKAEFEKIQNELGELSKQHEVSEQKLKEYQDKIKELESRKSAEKGVERIKKSVPGKSRTVEVIRTERKQLLENIKAKLAAGPSGTLSLADSPLAKILPDVAKLAKGYVEEGVIKLDDLVRKIHDDLKGQIDGLTERHVRDAISGYDKEPTTKPQSDETKRLTELKKQGKLLSKGEDADKGILPVKRAASAITDPELLKLKAETNRIKTKIDEKIKNVELENRTGLYKVLDWGAGWVKFAAISGPNTIAKLFSTAVSSSLILTPLRQIIQTGLAKIPGIDRIAAKAPGEGGVSVQGLAENYGSWWKKSTWDDIVQKARTGQSNLEAAHEKKRIADLTNTPLFNYMNNVHGAIKVLLFNSEYYKQVQTRAEYAISKGDNLADQNVQDIIHKGAFNDATRSIFQNKNQLNELYTSSLGRLESYGQGGKIAATLLRTALPITLTPTNILNTGSSYALGGAKAMWALRNGIDALDERQADHVMRSLGSQAVGIISVAVASALYKNFGGTTAKGDKRNPDDLRPGDIDVNGLHISHIFLHNPGLYAANIAAEAQRLIDQHKNDKPDDEGGKKYTALHAVWDATMAVGKELPFLEAGVSTGNYMTSSNPGKTIQAGAESKAKNMLIPQAIQQPAKWFDDKKRFPDTFVKMLETGIPGLSNTVVPEKKTFKAFNTEKQLSAMRGMTDAQIKDYLKAEDKNGKPIVKGYKAWENLKEKNPQLFQDKDSKKILKLVTGD